MSGYRWFTVAYSFFFFFFVGGGGRGGEVVNLTQEVFFSHSRNGFELSLYFKNSFMSYWGKLIGICLVEVNVYAY